MLKKNARRLFMFFYAPYCKLFKGFRLDSSVILNNHTSISKGCVIHRGNVISNTQIGYGSYLGVNNVLPNTVIGKYCCLAHNIQIISATHPTSDFVSFHPAFYSMLKQSGFTYTSHQRFKEHLFVDESNKITCKIGNDVWIGTNVTLLGGISVGDGAMIAAGSIVINDVEPYSMVGGVPAKLIRYRFTEKQRIFLLNFRWWDKEPQWLRENVDKFESIDNFCNTLNENS